MTITLEISEERERELREKASQRGQDPETFLLSLLDEFVLSDDLTDNRNIVTWSDPQERAEAFAGVQRGLADFAAGWHKPMEQVFADMKARHGIPD